MRQFFSCLTNKNAKGTEKAWATVQWHTAIWCCGSVLISCLAILAGCTSMQDVHPFSNRAVNLHMARELTPWLTRDCK